MKRKRILVSVTFPWLLLPGMLGVSQAKQNVSPAYAEVSAVANSTELGAAEKVARLREFLGREETRQMAFHHLETINPDVAAQEALKLFRSAGTPRQTKLWAGHFLLEGNRPQRGSVPKEFAAEFAKYLIQAIMNGGEAEFCQKQDGTALTAIGEYAFVSSDFSGYKGIDFSPFKDPRLVPVLIRCLDAPDHVFAMDQGCVIRGTSGEPTGRNTARQQIPVALARLGDAQAIAPLEKVLSAHTDICMRMNAAYALARLLDRREDRAALGGRLLAEEDLKPCRFPFAKGMIESGDDEGVAFLSLKHTTENPAQLARPNVIFYHLNERLSLLKGFQSPRVEPFIKELLSFQPWLDLVLFKPGSVKIDPTVDLSPPKDEAEALERQAPNIIATYGMMLECVKTNRMTSLADQLHGIARESHSDTVRRMTDECVKATRE